MHVQSINNIIAQAATMTPEEAQPYLKGLGLSIVTAIKVTREAHQIPLGEAKKAVALHPVWQAEATGGDMLHEEAQQILP